MLRTYRPLLLIAAVAAFIGGAVGVQSFTIDRLLYDDAVSTGRAWTEYLATNIADLDDIVAGKRPSPSSMAFFEQAKKVGQVFRYKIYDAEGRMVLVSDDLPIDDAEVEGLSEHNSEAAEAIEARTPMIEAKEGTPPTRPPYYSEAYVPVVVGDHVTAVVETYIDQTAKRAEFHRAFITAATALGLLIAFAFGIPAGAWYWRKREQERADARIHYLDHYDALSGLANRSLLVDRLTLALADIGTRNRPVAVHCIDIDRFKDINDTLGLNAGDMLLKIVADRLKALAGPEDIVARLAGDEFAIVQVNPGDRAGVETFAKAIVRQVSAPVWIKNHEVTPTVGVGIAVAPDHGRDPERLIKSADLALAKAKSEGRGQTYVFAADLDNELSARLKLERAIDTALATDGFTVHFQPLFTGDGERLVGFEALARLPTAAGSFIPPAEFIPAAERMGVIGRVGAIVLDAACSAAATWPEALAVSVNLSPAQFGKGSVTAVVAAALARTGLSPARLQLEITESLLLQDSKDIMGELAALKALGVAIVMDDFGTGYSSLSYLWRFPFDKIKIDQSFMHGIETNDLTAAKVVRTIVSLGRTLGMRVCVEGVETERHAAFALMIECDEVQGYHFGRPAPAADIAAVILADYRKGLAEADEIAARRASA